MAATARTSNAIIKRILEANSKEEAQEPLTAAIERYLIQRDRSKKRYKGHKIHMHPRPRPGGRLSPSSIGGCKRQAVFKFAGVKGKVKMDTRLELLFEDGNWRHHKWQYLFYDMQAVLGKKHFKVVSIESRAVADEHYIAGHLDAHLIINGKHIIVDIKGINSFGYKKVVLDTQQPMEHHVEQLISYMKARNVKRGIILYDCKDNSQYKCYAFQYTDEIWKEVTDWCESVIAYLDSKVLPGRHPDCRSGVFKYDHCQFRYLCFGRKTDKFLSELAYNNFVGVDQAWREGFAAFERAMEDQK